MLDVMLGFGVNIVSICISLLFCFIPAYIGQYKGRSFWGCFFLGILSPIIVSIVLCLLPNKNKEDEKIAEIAEKEEKEVLTQVDGFHLEKIKKVEKEETNCEKRRFGINKFVLISVLGLVLVVTIGFGIMNIISKSVPILTYDGFKVSGKHFALVANINKDSYANNMGYVTGDIDESEYMTLKHILVSFNKEDGTSISEEEALAEAERIKSEITDSNFDELMEKYSEDPGSKSQPEGYTFAHNSGTMMQEFDDGGWALKVGEVSEPVRTDYGYHIIKRVELIKDALPKNASEINWEEETDPASGEPVLESIKESAYSFLEERAILVKLAKDNDIKISKDDYEAEKEKTFEAMGGKEAAEKFFAALKYSNKEIKEFVELFVLPEKYYEFYNENLNHKEHFEAFLESDYYQEIAMYYGVDYTEYDDTDEELKNMIADFAFVDMLEKEIEKVEKNEEAYNSYK